MNDKRQATAAVHGDWRRYALGLAGATLFRVTLPATRLAVQPIDPWAVAFGRMAVAGLLAGAMLLALGERLRDRPTLARRAVVAGRVVLGVPLFSTPAMRTVDASDGGVVPAVPLRATAVVATARAGERPSSAFWLWALLGMLLVLAVALLRRRGALATDDLFLLLAGLLAAIGYAGAGAGSGLVVIGWALVLPRRRCCPPACCCRCRSTGRRTPRPGPPSCMSPLAANFLAFTFGTDVSPWATSRGSARFSFCKPS